MNQSCTNLSYWTSPFNFSSFLRHGRRTIKYARLCLCHFIKQGYIRCHLTLLPLTDFHFQILIQILEFYLSMNMVCNKEEYNLLNQQKKKVSIRIFYYVCISLSLCQSFILTNSSSFTLLENILILNPSVASSNLIWSMQD